MVEEDLKCHLCGNIVKGVRLEDCDTWDECEERRNKAMDEGIWKYAITEEVGGFSGHILHGICERCAAGTARGSKRLVVLLDGHSGDDSDSHESDEGHDEKKRPDESRLLRRYKNVGLRCACCNGEDVECERITTRVELAEGELEDEVEWMTCCEACHRHARCYDDLVCKYVDTDETRRIRKQGIIPQPQSRGKGSSN